VGPTNQTGADLGEPRTIYQSRRQERRQQQAVCKGRERVLGFSRLAAFLLLFACLGFVFGLHSLSAWVLPLPAAALLLLLVAHDRIRRKEYLAGRAVAFYDTGLARLDDRWAGRGQPGERFRDDNHPYSSDLDLFGRGSLFELLCTARTRAGEDTLASWLKGAAKPEEVRDRQQAVAELRPQLDLREDLALLGSDVPAGVDFEAVARWGEAPARLSSVPLRLLTAVLGSASLITCLGWLAGEWNVLVFLCALLPAVTLALALYTRVQAVLKDVERRGHDLGLLASVLARLEQGTFTSPRLVNLHADLNGPEPPSQQIARLGNLLDLLAQRRNQLFLPFALLLLWGTQCAFALERWRLRNGPKVATWLGVVGQFDALCALATFAYENPDDPFPEVLPDGPFYDGEGLGHPLLPRAVRNDLRLGGELKLMVVSGSNMSGKSTFLRSVGINAVLALAGATVKARRLRLSPLALGTTLRVQDSLQAGRSRFYAEILRVRQVVELSRGPLPLLFLIDEIFAGTNSHDRRLGAEAVIRGLVNAGAIGLVTTHDLSLTRIADELGSRAANVHFADQLNGEEMTFDFRLRPGVVGHSNALALMRAVGLEV
jgi:hypothetical protein